MAEARLPDSPPVPGEPASVRIFEQMYIHVVSGNIKAMTDYMEAHNISPQSFKTLVENRYYPSLRYSPVATAARAGQLDVLRMLVSLGFSPEESSRNMTGKNEYPIHLACAANQVAVVRCLIHEYGVCVDARDSGDTTPIFWAILTENMDMLRLLVEAGANVSDTFHDTMTPLLFAAFMINTEMCQYLMDNGADVNEQGDCGNTPLCLSLRDVHTSRILIDAGADVNHVNRPGDTPFLLAVKRNYKRTLELLGQRGADTNVRDSAGRTPLHHAIDREYDDQASHLIINLNVDLNVQDSAGRTPFHIAFYLRNIALVQLLLAAGVDSGKEAIVYDDEPYDKLIPDWYDVVQKCQHMGRNAQPLEHLCRMRVRKLLGTDLLSLVDELPLPSLIKDDLTLKHFDKRFELSS